MSFFTFWVEGSVIVAGCEGEECCAAGQAVSKGKRSA